MAEIVADFNWLNCSLEAAEARVDTRVTAESGTSARELAQALAARPRPIMVRGHQVDRGLFWLDPCNLHPGEAEEVAQALRDLTA